MKFNAPFAFSIVCIFHFFCVESMQDLNSTTIEAMDVCEHKIEPEMEAAIRAASSQRVLALLDNEKNPIHANTLHVRLATHLQGTRPLYLEPKFQAIIDLINERLSS